MGNRDKTVRLYSLQTDTVLGVIENEGACFSKADYVRRKYQESAPVFLAAYGWYASHAKDIVPVPPGGEYPYWAFAELYNAQQSADGNVLTLSVPPDEAVFFDMYDWNKIMRLSYIGENEDEEREFVRELRLRGLSENDVMLSSFYPDLKEKTLNSWKRLFRHHERIKQGDRNGVQSVQAGLWQIKKDWLR